MADFDFKKYDLEHWWKVIAAAGGAVLVAAVAVKFVPAIMLGLGLLAFGVGSWINHPLQTELGPGFKVTSYPRSASIAGVLLELGGAALVLIGLFKLAVA